MFHTAPHHKKPTPCEMCRVGTSGVLCEHSNEPSGSIKGG